MSNSPFDYISEFSKSQPDACAVKDAERALSYKELHDEVLKISDFLQVYGKKSANPIGIFVDKSTSAVAAIYGVLNLGACYVPIDVNNPQERTEFIIQQSTIEIILCDTRQAPKLNFLIENGYYDVKIINIDIIRNSTDGFSSQEKKYKLATQTLASILYTSGSTGTPKGVRISLNAVRVFVDWAAEYFNLSSQDNCISHAPFHFDLSLFDIFACHKAGATLVLLDTNKVANPRFIASFIEENKITIWQSVPSVLILLNKYGSLDRYNLSSLRHVIFAGGTINKETLVGLISHTNNCMYHNIYGCTETNDTFAYSFDQIDQDSVKELPIGIPLPFVEYRIIDDRYEDTKDGEEGMLFVKTPTMMDGYQNSSHVPSGFEINLPEHLQDFYMTNDKVVRKDGLVYFLGRTDDIVKTNGYRVNLLEIEAALLLNPVVQEAAVIAEPDSDSGKTVIAHIKATDEINSLELNHFLSSKLPKYSIPKKYRIGSEGLPKTSSGKINKKLLNI